MTFRVKVLIVEQHASLSEQIRQVILNESGLELIGEARNPDQALALLADCMPDVIIMDMHLRDKCGLEAIPRLLAKAPHAGVILLTDQDDLRYQRAAERNGVHTCVRKDLIASALVASVGQLCGRLPEPGQSAERLSMKERM